MIDIYAGPPARAAWWKLWWSPSPQGPTESPPSTQPRRWAGSTKGEQLCDMFGDNGVYYTHKGSCPLPIVFAGCPDHASAESIGRSDPDAPTRPEIQYLETERANS